MMPFCGQCELGFVRVQIQGWGGRTLEAVRRCRNCNALPAAVIRRKRTIPAPLVERIRAARSCVCGMAKREGLSFCRECYLTLPVAMRQGLWTKDERQWARVYGRAKRFLAGRVGK